MAVDFVLARAQDFGQPSEQEFVPFAYSLKSLLILITAIAVTVGGSQKLHQLYCLQELNRRAELGDGCSVLETLRYAEDHGFPANWADQTWAQAAHRGAPRILRLFVLERDIDQTLDGDLSALMISASRGHFNTVKFLLAQGADVSLRNADGKTAGDLSREHEHHAVAALLEASQQHSWATVSQIEDMLERAKRLSEARGEPLLDIMERSAFGSLSALRLEGFVEGNHTLWFQANDVIQIGITSGSNSYTWIIDGARVEDVKYYSPSIDPHTTP